MNYVELINDINTINDGIDNKKNERLDLFRVYIEKVKGINSFNAENIWDQSWREKIWGFGEKFSSINGHDASQFLEILKENNWESNEGLSFIYSEILWNFFNHDHDFIKDTLKEIIKKYPGNPEFYNAYGHYLLSKKEYKKAIENYQKAISLDKKNNTYTNTLFNEWHRYNSELLIQGKIIEAEKVQQEMEIYYFKDENKEEWVYRNLVFSLGERIKDHKAIQSKIDGLNGLVDKRIEGVRSHLINVISVLTAIIGYLLTGVTLSLKDKSIKESFFLLIGTGLVIILFVLITSYQFRSRRNEKFFDFLKHREFWFIILVLVTLIIMYQTR